MKRLDMEKCDRTRKKLKMKRGPLTSNRLNKMYDPDYLRSRVKMGVITPKKKTQPEVDNDYTYTSQPKRQHRRKIDTIKEKIAPWERELPDDHQFVYDHHDAIFKEITLPLELPKYYQDLPDSLDKEPSIEDLLNSLDKEHSIFMAMIGKVGPKKACLRATNQETLTHTNTKKKPKPP